METFIGWLEALGPCARTNLSNIRNHENLLYIIVIVNEFSVYCGMFGDRKTGKVFLKGFQW